MSVSEGTISEVTIDADLRDYGAVKNVFLQLFTDSNGKLSFRTLLVMQDHTLLMIKNGKVSNLCVKYLMYSKIIWNRLEALASIVDVEMVDLPAPKDNGKTNTIYATLKLLKNWATEMFNTVSHSNKVL